MQLDKIVMYHKALADPTRIRLLLLLTSREVSGQELATKLGVSPPTITHHIKALREATLINERREKNTIYFTLNETVVQQKNQAILNLLFKEKKGDAEDMTEIMSKNEKLAASVLANFYTKEGSLKQIPSQLKKKLIVLENMVEKLEKGRKYAEKEINEFIKEYHPDFATIRREFIMQQYMYREEGTYEVNPREMWAKWQEL